MTGKDVADAIRAWWLVAALVIGGLTAVVTWTVKAEDTHEDLNDELVVVAGNVEEFKTRSEQNQEDIRGLIELEKLKKAKLAERERQKALMDRKMLMWCSDGSMSGEQCAQAKARESDRMAGQ